VCEREGREVLVVEKDRLVCLGLGRGDVQPEELIRVSS
jgi:hypothetical protein